MSKDELEKIYQQLEHVARAQEDLAKLIREIKEKLASGGGPGEERK